MGSKHVKMYTLSTCSHCKAAKKFMRDNGVDYEFVDVDLLKGADQASVIERVREWNPRLSFPTIIIGDVVIVGFQEGQIREALGL